MNIKELHELLDKLLKEGIDPKTPICQISDQSASHADEICDVHQYEGTYRGDPSPKMCSFIIREGAYLLLDSNNNLDSLSNFVKQIR